MGSELSFQQAFLIQGPANADLDNRAGQCYTTAYENDFVTI
jgi:hypothetical protein